ncbi:2-succinyl-6-hydroxy-2,4-cyclohexadiene-1-carboxylate synthase [compost metagenome]
MNRCGGKEVVELDLFYTETGNKEAPMIVFLHGGGVSGWMWERQVEYFQNYHCLVPDIPGHGRRESGTFSMNDAAEALIELVQSKAKGKKVILIGFSLGAQLALSMLSKVPTLADYAVINSALTRPFRYANKFIAPMVKMTSGWMTNRSFAKLQAKQLYIGEDMFEQYFKDSRTMKAEVLIEVLEENMSFSIPDGLEDSKCKVLVTVGAREKKMMRQSAKDIVSQWSGCKGVIISGVGHGVSLARPELFNKMVDAWIHESELPKGLIPLNT